ncbi:hypothetical protein M422DRAFT_157377 [Sphaerobolus stellatus SS14]|nr:hypothetical protein M422DRAFT_157377 [Sphaerobolus stellatus SS14]
MSTPLRRSARVHSTTASILSTSFSTTSAALTPKSIAASSSKSAEAASIVRARKKVKIEVDGDSVAVETKVEKTKKTTRPKKSKGPIALPLDEYPTRVQSAWKVGAHVSATGGVENAVLNAVSIGANAFALFVKSQRKWSSSSMTQESIDAFKARLKDYKYDPHLVLPHGSYLINLGNPDREKREKSYDCFLDDLKRCEALGLTRYNFHPGSTVGAATKEESIAHIASCINRAHKETKFITVVIENMAGSGNVLGSKFEEIASMIELVKDKSRVGVCIDTCHTFVAGYDIRTKESYESTISEFDQTVGLKYLCGMHINGSKAALGSHKDRHDNVGRGEIPLSSFGYMMRDTRLQNIPMILETPINDDTNIWQKEIEVCDGLSTGSLGLD